MRFLGLGFIGWRFRAGGAGLKAGKPWKACSWQRWCGSYPDNGNAKGTRAIKAQEPVNSIKLQIPMPPPRLLAPKTHVQEGEHSTIT